MSNIYCMEIDGIAGPEKLGTLSGQILIDSFKFGVHRFLRSTIGQGKNRELTVPNVSSIIVNKSFDATSTKIHSEALFGKGKTIKLRMLKSSDNLPAQVATTITLTDAVLTAHNMDAHLGNNLSEELTINFSKYTIEYTPIGSDGKKLGNPSMVGYDIAKVKKA